MLMGQVLVVVIDSIIYSSWLFIAAIGLTLIYGVMKIVNLTHGSFYALGAYVAASAVGALLAKGYSPALSYAVLLASALFVGFVIGPLLERIFLSRMYARDEVVLMLITYALFLIIEDTIKLIWGVSPYFIADPYSYLGNLEYGELNYPLYNFLLVAVAAICGGLLTWVLNHTHQGKLLLAVIHDREVSATLGINVSRMYRVTFAGGSALAAIGGAFTAPTVSVVPGLGVEVIVLSFAVVVIGGLGSLPGAAIGALIVGMVRSISVHYWPEVELFTIYFVMAMVLAFRPRGLFMSAETRKI
jgi:branched-chain amino acid transport system permease protein